MTTALWLTWVFTVIAVGAAWVSVRTAWMTHRLVHPKPPAVTLQYEYPAMYDKVRSVHLRPYGGCRYDGHQWPSGVSGTAFLYDLHTPTSEACIACGTIQRKVFR